MASLILLLPSCIPGQSHWIPPIWWHVMWRHCKSYRPTALDGSSFMTALLCSAFLWLMILPFSSMYKQLHTHMGFDRSDCITWVRKLHSVGLEVNAVWMFNFWHVCGDWLKHGPDQVILLVLESSLEVVSGLTWRAACVYFCGNPCISNENILQSINFISLWFFIHAYVYQS